MSEFNNTTEESFPKKKEFKKEELSFTKPIPSSLKSEVRGSGYCGSCHTRYFDVPIIDGVPQCTNCKKL